MDNINKIIEKNNKYLREINIIDNNISQIKNILNNINNQKITIISWMRESWKSKIISYLINKTNIWENYIYFNKDLDNLNIIKSDNELDKYISSKNSKYIFLQNCWSVKWIKNVISKYYKINKKIILIWNDIVIPNINIFETNISIDKNNIENNIIYWNIDKLKAIDDKKIWLELIISNLFLKSIFDLKSVKNIKLYYFVITFLAFNNNYLSNRELLKSAQEIETISPKTFYDYIDFSIQEKIIYKVDLYDIKKQKIINGKSKYYFSDNWIRNYLSNFELDNKTLWENIIFVYLKYNNFTVYWWKNWVFELSFIAEKDNKKIYIHLSNNIDKNEIKKEINKLLKIPDDNKKYLIIESFDKYNIRKSIYDEVELIELKNLLIKKSL